MEFRYKQNLRNSLEPNKNSELPKIYVYITKNSDDTSIELLSTRLYFYNSTDKQVTVMKANKVNIKIWNKDWHQAGKYLVAKSLYWFSAQNIIIIKDDYASDVIKQIIEDEDSTNSFVAIEVNQTLHNSLPSK